MYLEKPLLFTRVHTLRFSYLEITHNILMLSIMIIKQWVKRAIRIEAESVFQNERHRHYGMQHPLHKQRFNYTKHQDAIIHAWFYIHMV